MNSFDERVLLANDILMKLGVQLKLKNPDEINSQLFIMLYRSLFLKVPETIVENDESKDASNIEILLQSLSQDVLHVSLNHIDAKQVVNGVPSAVMNVLEIFQGLLDCLRRKKDINEKSFVDEDVKRLQRVIKDTNDQTDNLTRITKENFGGRFEREKYLQKKIEELLGRFGGLSDFSRESKEKVELMNYVNAERDRVKLIKDHCKMNGKIAEDDLTVVTEGHEPTECDQDVSHCSQETYVMATTSEGINLSNRGKMNDAWAQVNKDYIQQGYENEFLDMLLEQECIENTVKPSEENGGIKRRRRGCDGRSVTSRSSGSTARCRPGSGLVRPVIRHINEHCYRSSDTQSLASGRTITPRTTEDNEDLMTQLLQHFPALTISEQTLRKLWSQAERQAADIHRVAREVESGLGPGEQRVEDARRRQQLLVCLLRKEAMQQARLRERVEERESQMSLKSTKDRQRQQSAKARRYYDEFAQRHKARMLQKQSKEEQVFRTMFNAALKIQRERMTELRRYARDKKQEKLSRYRSDLESIENYYRDRFAMLADCVRSERRAVTVQDRAEQRAIERQKTEIRGQLETEIRLLHESMARSEHELYFRGLDADRAVDTVAMVGTGRK